MLSAETRASTPGPDPEIGDPEERRLWREKSKEERSVQEGGGDGLRRQYITKLLSSSLLHADGGSSGYASPDLQDNTATCVTLRVEAGREVDIIKFVQSQIGSLIGCAWFVAKCCDEPATWLILHTQGGASNTGPDEEEDSKNTDLDKAGNPLREFFSTAADLGETPPTVTRLLCTVAPADKQTYIPEDSVVTNNGIINECVRIKIGQEKFFIDSCVRLVTFLRSPQRPASEQELLALEVYRNMDPQSGNRIFQLFYYFKSEVGARDYKKKEAWRRWRREIAPLLDGSPRLQFFQAIFDSRGRRTALSAAAFQLEEETSIEPSPTIQTPADSSTATPTALLSPVSIVSHARDSYRRRIGSAVSEAETRAASQIAGSDAIEAVFSSDKRLEQFADHLRDRVARYQKLRDQVLALPIEGRKPLKLADMAVTHRHFGLNRYCRAERKGWVLREWLPSVEEVHLRGDFNHWDLKSHPLKQADPSSFGEGVWEVFVPDAEDGSRILKHESRHKLHVKMQKNNERVEVDRIPPCSGLVWKSIDSDIHNAIVWDPENPYTFSAPVPKNKAKVSLTLPLIGKADKGAKVKPGGAFRRNEPLTIYEAYAGLAPTPEAENDRLGTYLELKQSVLPRIKRLGYNTLLLLGVPEHSRNLMGWHVTNYFAPASMFGTPRELKELIDAAHKQGLSVLMSVVHSHASPNAEVGIDSYDNADGGYFREGEAGRQNRWDARVFDYQKPEVCRFLLAQLSYWAEEYHVDGFRFEGLTSMLYHHHGLGQDFRLWHSDLSQYFSYEVDEEALAYLMLANAYLREAHPNLITIGVDYSRMPLLTAPVQSGGLGFDLCSSNNGADEWVRLLRRGSDLDWQYAPVVRALEDRSVLDHTVAYSEDWSSCLRARRPLCIAMFAWESLHTHAVGGVAPHVTELAAALCRLGHEVHVYVRAVAAIAQHSVHYGVFYHECPFQLNSDFVSEMENMCASFVESMLATERFMGRQFDICHAHDWLAARAMMRAKELGRLCIQTMHSTEYGRCGNKLYGGQSKRIYDIECAACHSADRVICVSGVLAEEVGKLFSVNPEKLRVIYNGINANNFDGFEDAAPIKARYGVPALDPMFLFVGRMAIQKGPDLLVEAIPYVLQFRSDAKFVFVGDGYMKVDLVRRVSDLGVGHACRFVGAKSGPELISLFKACDAVVVPSRNEPFGIVVLEAWSSYKPVVATTCGGPRDFLTPDVDGCLVEPTAGSISWGCCEILKNFEHARWMGQRGRVKAAYSFSWNCIGKSTEGLYYEQLNRHDAPYSAGGLGDCTLTQRLAGQALALHMGVFDEDSEVTKAMAFHKLIRLMTAGLGGEAYLNFMGNEFGHPDFVDPPRGGNNHSAAFAKRRYALADNTALKYKHLEFFDACMVRTMSILGWLAARHQYVILRGETDKVVAFERGPCLFIFNFHPTQDYVEYQVGHSLGPDLRVVLDTDEVRFGGQGHLTEKEKLMPFRNHESFHGRLNSVKLPLPHRSALVLVPVTLCSLLHQDPVLQLEKADDYVKLVDAVFF